VFVVIPRRLRGNVPGSVTLPDGRWRGLDDACHSGTVAVAELLEAFPVGVLVREA
jgi:hypothetical protein